MDTDRIAEFVSTVIIVGMIAVLAVPQFGVSGLRNVLLAAAVVSLTFGVAFSAFLVYVVDAGESHLGPWGPEDAVFIAAVAPPVFGTVWAADAAGLDGVTYGVVVAVGLLASILFAVVVRDATVGEWPPGSSTNRERERGPPQQ